MKKFAFVILPIMVLSCAPSVTQKPSNKPTNKCYEINVTSGIKVKKSILRAVDSLTNEIISKRVVSNDSIKDYHFVININELKWYCPEQSRIDAESFAVGFAGGLIGSTIWGTTHFTSVYGISKLNVIVNRSSDTLNIDCNDTVNFKDDYLSYSNSRTKKKAMCGAFAKSVVGLMGKISEKQIMTSDNWK